MAIKYKEQGVNHGTLMVFLHGGGVSGWMWEKQIQYFTNYHCIVPDLYEHGMNYGGVHFSINENAKEIIELIEEKGNGKEIILIGFSLGAQVAIQIMSIKPNLVDYAIINSALVRQIIYKKLIPFSIKLSFPLIKRKWFSKLQAKTMYLDGEYFEKYYEESYQLKLDTLTRVLQENMSFGIPKDFGNVQTKILVTVGQQEKSIMRKSAKDLVNMNSNCVGIIFPKVGHGASLAKPEFFNTVVETWLQEGKLPMECKVIHKSDL